MILKKYIEFINEASDLSTIMKVEDYLEEFRKILSSDDGINILVRGYDRSIKDLEPYMNATHMLRDRSNCQEFLDVVKNLKVVKSLVYNWKPSETGAGQEVNEEITVYEADKGRIALIYLNNDTDIPSHVFMDEEFLSSNFLTSMKGIDKYSL
jgi:hypothetical protein